jgi:hypothetical protein
MVRRELFFVWGVLFGLKGAQSTAVMFGNLQWSVEDQVLRAGSWSPHFT